MAALSGRLGPVKQLLAPARETAPSLLFSTDCALVRGLVSNLFWRLFYFGLERIRRPPLNRLGMSFDVSSTAHIPFHAEFYEAHAAHCVSLAKETASSETKLILLHMARAWLLLAEQSQKNDQTALVYETPEQQ